MNLFKVILSKITEDKSKIMNILSLVVTQFFLLSTVSMVLAQSSDAKLDMSYIYSDGYNATVVTSGDRMSSATTTSSSSLGALHFAGVFIIGTEEGFKDLSAEAGVDNVELSPLTQKGLITATEENVTAMLYNPPGINIPLHLAKEWVPGYDQKVSVMAADTGYSHLQGIGVEEIWQMFRNIAYVGFVLVLVATGFMIMFRTKIGGQTAVTVMNSLPSIMVGLILVTFSFAIVGFVIDLSRLFTGIIENILHDSLSDFETVPLGGPLQLARWAFGDAFSATWKTWSPTSGSGLVSGILNFLKNIPLGVGKLIITVIFGFVALYAAVKVFMVLVMSYVKILMDLILGPIHILIGSLPGSKNSVINWIKRLLVNSLVFPIVFFIINIFRYIGRSDINNPITENFSGFMSGGADIDQSYIQLKGAIVLAGYFIASGAPGIVEDLFQLKESPGVAKAMGNVQKSASEIPVIGGLFKG